jgi:hypothetical protein
LRQNQLTFLQGSAYRFCKNSSKSNRGLESNLFCWGLSNKTTGYIYNTGFVYKNISRGVWLLIWWNFSHHLTISATFMVVAFWLIGHFAIKSFSPAMQWMALKNLKVTSHAIDVNELNWFQSTANGDTGMHPESKHT